MWLRIRTSSPSRIENRQSNDDRYNSCNRIHHLLNHEDRCCRLSYCFCCCLLAGEIFGFGGRVSVGCELSTRCIGAKIVEVHIPLLSSGTLASMIHLKHVEASVWQSFKKRCRPRGKRRRRCVSIALLFSRFFPIIFTGSCFPS